MEAKNWYEVMLLWITTISVLLQLYVIVVVVRVSPPSMKIYRFFLIAYTVFDMLFTISVGFIMEPETIFSEAPAAYVRGLGRLLGPNGGNISLLMSMFFGAAVIMCTDYMLLYRFTVIHPDPQVHEYFMRPTTIMFFQVVAFIINLFITITTHKSLVKPEEILSQLSNFSAIVSSIKEEQSMVVLLNQNARSSETMVVTILVGFALSELICFALGFLIIRKLRQNSDQFTPKNYKMHLQLTVLLIAQLVTPIVFIVFPVSFAMVSFLFKVRLNRTSGQVGVLLLAVYATSNSLLTIIFVSPYRKFTRRALMSTRSRISAKFNRVHCEHLASKVVEEEKVRRISIRADYPGMDINFFRPIQYMQ